MKLKKWLERRKIGAEVGRDLASGREDFASAERWKGKVKAYERVLEKVKELDHD